MVNQLQMKRLGSIVLLSLIVMAVMVWLWPRSVEASPAAGGTLTVNSTLDTNTSDSVLTLREALLIARGGTGSNGLNRTLSNSEKSLAVGCSTVGTPGDWTITGGCGTGITDTIVFNLASFTISPNSPLPLVDDTAPTIINGAAGLGSVSIDTSGVGSGHNGLHISSDNNTVMNLEINGSPNDNFYVDGNNNLFSNVLALGASVDGMYISGNNNTVKYSWIGSGNGGCWGNAGDGIKFATTAQYNTVDDTLVGCNGAIGIDILSTSGAGHQSIGPNNLIGSGDANGTIDRGNGSHGLAVLSTNNLIFSNTIGFNGANGIDISRGFNAVYANLVYSNTGSGIRLYSLAQNNDIGCTFLCLSISGNHVSNNVRYGLEITGTSVSFNIIEGNQFGTYTPPYPLNSLGGNKLDGVLIYAAHDNYLGAAGRGLNSISGNKGNGLTLDNAAYNNSVKNNCIGVYCWPDLTGGYINHNYARGIALINGAHDNQIGSSGLGNSIGPNTLDGIFISGANTAYNTVDANGIGSNQTGISLANSAHDNVIGSSDNARNSISDSDFDGIALYSGAYSNTIGYNTIGASNYPNGASGISIDTNAYNNFIGASTFPANVIKTNPVDNIRISSAGAYGNRVFNNDLESSANNGIEITGGAHGNTIGGVNRANVITQNAKNGILLSGAAHDNTVANNIIHHNGANGIELTDANTDANYIQYVTVYSNTFDGINERATNNNHWSQISTYWNGGLGIDINAPINLSNTIDFPVPVVVTATLFNNQVTVTGTATASTGSDLIYVELYRAAADPSNYGEGQQYLGGAYTNGSGRWVITYNGTFGGCYTAFQTDHSIDNFTDDSSEFGHNLCFSLKVYLPLVLKAN